MLIHDPGITEHLIDQTGFEYDVQQISIKEMHLPSFALPK